MKKFLSFLAIMLCVFGLIPFTNVKAESKTYEDVWSEFVGTEVNFGYYEGKLSESINGYQITYTIYKEGTTEKDFDIIFAYDVNTGILSLTTPASSEKLTVKQNSWYDIVCNIILDRFIKYKEYKKEFAYGAMLIGDTLEKTGFYEKCEYYTEEEREQIWNDWKENNKVEGGMGMTLPTLTTEWQLDIVNGLHYYSYFNEQNQYKQDFVQYEYDLKEIDSLSFRFIVELDRFDNKVYLDGELLDSSNYTVKSGSTIIELKPEFIKTLENGDHNLTASFDITDVSAYFKIKNAEVAQSNTQNKEKVDNPKTGSTFGYSELIVFGLLGMIVLIILGKSKKLIKNV